MPPVRAVCKRFRLCLSETSEGLSLGLQHADRDLHGGELPAKPILDAAEAVFEAVDAILVVSLLIREGVLLLFEKALETIGIELRDLLELVGDSRVVKREQLTDGLDVLVDGVVQIGAVDLENSALVRREANDLLSGRPAAPPSPPMVGN